MESKKFLNLEEVAAEFGLDAATLQQFVDSGDVKALADRGTWKYRRDELQGLVEAGKIAPPVAGSWTDQGTDASGQVLTVGEQTGDDLSYIELDEEALAEHATMISKQNPVDRTPVEGAAIDEDWFVTSGAEAIADDKRQSSSDVVIVTPPSSPLEVTDSDVRVASGGKFSESALESAEIPAGLSDSDSDVRLVGSLSKLAMDAEQAAQAAAHPDSDSDVRIAEETPAAGPDASGIVLDFDMGAGATVSASGSSLRLPQTAGGAEGDEGFSKTAADQTDVAAQEVPDRTAAAAQRGSGVSLAKDESNRAGDSGLVLEGLSDAGSAIRLGGDSSVHLPGTAESGIVLDSGSHIGLTGDSAVVAGSSTGLADLEDESGLSLESVDDDSGLSIESSKDDSGLALEDDSGLAMAPGDSGITLEPGDSGLALESASDSGISTASSNQTLSDDDFAATMLSDAKQGAGETQTLNLDDESDDDSSFDTGRRGNTATAEIFVDDEDADETAATVVKKGRGKGKPARDALSLSESFDLDEPPQVEDLEISEDLDVGVEEELEAEIEAEEEEIFEASDETFSGEIEEAEDEDYLTPAAAAKPIGPREPAWGMGMAIGLIACALVLTANTLILWAGVSTMWNGAEASGPAATLISSLGGLLG